MHLGRTSSKRKYPYVGRLALCLCASVVLFASCSGDTGPGGPRGPTGDPGAPVPINVLFAGSEAATSLEAMAVAAFRDRLFPLGSEINYVDVTDSIPPLSWLRQYDAVLLWTTSAVADPVTLGDTMADYVDSGGGLVIGQLSFVDGSGLQGRITMPGYSPFQSGPPVGVVLNRKIDFLSLAVPLHVIFNGTDVLNFSFYSTDEWSNPPLAPTATLIAADDGGANAVAVSANGRIVGINMSGNFLTGGFDNPPKLIANSLLFVAGAF